MWLSYTKYEMFLLPFGKLQMWRQFLLDAAKTFALREVTRILERLSLPLYRYK